MRWPHPIPAYLSPPLFFTFAGAGGACRLSDMGVSGPVSAISRPFACCSTLLIRLSTFGWVCRNSKSSSAPLGSSSCADSRVRNRSVAPLAWPYSLFQFFIFSRTIQIFWRTAIFAWHYSGGKAGRPRLGLPWRQLKNEIDASALL